MLNEACVALVAHFIITCAVQIYEQAFKFAAELRTKGERLSNIVLMVSDCTLRSQLELLVERLVAD